MSVISKLYEVIDNANPDVIIVCLAIIIIVAIIVLRKTINYILRKKFTEEDMKDFGKYITGGGMIKPEDEIETAFKSWKE